MLRINHYYQNLNRNHHCDICDTNGEQLEGVLATCTVDGLTMLLCDNCINRYQTEHPAKNAIQIAAEIDAAQLELDARQKFADREGFYPEEQPADDFNAHVESMEAAIAGAWQTIEVYRSTMQNLSWYTHEQRFEDILTSKNGVVTSVERHYNAGEVTQLSYLRGMNTWGLHLREQGFRKVETFWINTITDEKTYINPAKA